MDDADNIEKINTWQQDYEQVQVSQIYSGEKNVDHKSDVEQYESKGEEEAVETDEIGTWKQDGEDEGGSEDLADSEDTKMEIKEDPEDYNSEDKEGIKEEPDSESEDLGEIPFFEEEYKEDSKFHDPVATTGFSHEPQTGDRLNKYDKMGNKVKHGSNNFQCEKCTKCFPTNARLNIHRVTHLPKKPFVCDHCGKDFAQKGNLRTHEKTFHPQDEMLERMQFDGESSSSPNKKFRGATDWKPYRTESECGKPKCVKCGKEFSCVKNLKIHVRHVHIGIDKPKCDKCEKEFSSLKNLKIHLRNVHSESAEFGEIPFVEEVYAEDDNFHEPLAITGLSHEVNEDDSKHDIKVKIENFENLQFGSQRNSITKKKYRGHTDWKPYRTESECGKPKCKKCGKEFSNVKNLKIHVRNVHILKKSGPERITKRTRLPKDESPGKKPVTPIEERTCMICGRIFDKKSQMKLHLLKHTKVYKNLNVEGKILRSENGTSGTCLECGIVGKTNNLKPHIANVHYQLIKTLDLNNMENYDLSEGGTALKGDGTAQRRERTMQTFLCEYCEKVFNDFDRSNLNKHIRYVHEGIRRKKKEGQTWLCEYCDKQFSDNKGLKRHKQFKHEGFGFECDICGYTAITPLGLVKHRSGKHGITLSEVPEEVTSSSHQCMECGKFYSSTSALKMHLYIHTGEKPFECDQCEKKFSRKVGLDLHTKNRHTKEMPLICNVCEIKFVTKAAFKDHQLKVHPDL